MDWRAPSSLMLAGALAAGCLGHSGSGYCHDRPSAGALIAAVAIEVLFEAAAAGAERAAERRKEDPPPPPGMTGVVLWQGKAGDGVPSLPLTLVRQGQPVDRTVTDLRGRFVFPGPYPAGVYRLVIDDDTLRGSMMFSTSGSARDLAVSAYLR